MRIKGIWVYAKEWKTSISKYMGKYKGHLYFKISLSFLSLKDNLGKTINALRDLYVQRKHTIVA